MVSLQPLGDQGVLASHPDETTAWQWAAQVRALSVPWLVDVVQAYTTVAVYFDWRLTRSQDVVAVLCPLTPTGTNSAHQSRQHRLPCCYEWQLDLQRVAEHTRLTPPEVIAWHTSVEYTVYAIGFCPGFPYLGYLPTALQGVPRLPSPRLRVEAGSVGLTGRQTGIYTEARPGGWNILGRTPLLLVDVTTGYFPLRTGDRVQFYPITRAEFDQLLGQRLAESVGS